jgi:hypothetical protein
MKTYTHCEYRLLVPPKKEKLFFQFAEMSRAVWNEMLRRQLNLQERGEPLLSEFSQDIEYTRWRNSSEGKHIHLLPTEVGRRTIRYLNQELWHYQQGTRPIPPFLDDEEDDIFPCPARSFSFTLNFVTLPKIGPIILDKAKAVPRRHSAALIARRHEDWYLATWSVKESD